MLTLFYKPRNKDEDEVSGETPKLTFSAAFRKLGCRTLDEFNNLVEYGHLVGATNEFCKFKSEDHLSAHEIAIDF